MEPYIKIDEYEGDAWVEAHGEVQMYAGDKGSEVCLSMQMTKEQLKTVISTMIKTYRKLAREESTK